MIFVNDVAGVRDIPFWLKHAAPGSPGMTFADVVFPAFLFIVGLSLPFALAQRKKKYPGQPLFLHVLTRTAGLLVLGLLMLNGPAVSSMNAAWWNVLMYAGAILFWAAYPENEKRKAIFPILKWTGFALLVFLLAIYRRGSGDTLSWIQTGWWGILGEIGFAYAATALLYLLFRDRPALLLSIPALCILLYIADRSGQLDFLGRIRTVFYPGSHFGTHVLISFSGLLCGHWLFGRGPGDHRAYLKKLGIFALLCGLAGYALYGLYGVDKIAATPSWALFSTAICILIFMLCYGVLDVGGKKGAYPFFKPIAVNPLLAYLLHVMLIYVFRLAGFASFYGSQLGAGIIGILRAAAYTGFIYLITRLLTKAGVKLKL